MSLSINTSVDAARVLVEGEVDVSNADELRNAVDAALALDAPEVTVDLSQVPYIDSTGIGVLVGAAHRALCLRLRHQRRHTVHHDHVHRSAADQRVRDLQRLLAAVRLTDVQVVDVHADVRRVDRV